MRNNSSKSTEGKAFIWKYNDIKTFVSLKNCDYILSCISNFNKKGIKLKEEKKIVQEKGRTECKTMTKLVET